MPNHPIQAFFSYARVDWKDSTSGPILEEALAALEGHTRSCIGDRGFTIWRDDQLRWGEKWRERLHEVIGQCDLFIILMSPGWLKSEICFVEHEAFIKREAGLPEPSRILVLPFQPVSNKDGAITAEMQGLHDILQERQFRNWERLPSKKKKNRLQEYRTAASELADKVREIRNNVAVSATLRQCAPYNAPVAAVALTGGRTIVSGSYDMPTQGQGRVTLTLGFVPRACINIKGHGEVFFAVTAAVVNSEISSGRIIEPRAEFARGHRPQTITVKQKETSFKIRELYILAVEGMCLEGEVLCDPSEAGPVEIFTVDGEEKNLIIKGEVELHYTGIRVEESDIIIDRNDSKRNTILKRIAEIILRKHGSKFQLNEFRK